MYYTTLRRFNVRADRVDKPRAYLLCFHGWGGSSELLYKDTNISFISKELNIDIIYPEGEKNWLGIRSWQSSPREGSGDLRAFDTWYRARKEDVPVFLSGYSDGAAFANYVACLRDTQISGVFSYAGRLQLDKVETKNKFPVVIVFNRGDRHYQSRQDRKTRILYKNAGHRVYEHDFPGEHIRKEGWLPSKWHHDWHPSARELLRNFINYYLVNVGM